MAHSELGGANGWGLSSSFVTHLRSEHPELVHGLFDAAAVRALAAAQAPEAAPGAHGTTVLAMRFDRGVVMAGDRRATEGFTIASRGIEKVFPADSHSAVAIAGAAGPAVEMVRLFQVELEHYEKIEGRRLSLEGKANRLAEMIRQNLMAALQLGLAVVPIFCGFDLGRGVGRIFKYDLAGGRYEERDFHSTGSGGRDARSYVKGRWHEGMTEDAAVGVALEALFEASDEDAGTGGPDVLRRIYPNIAVIDADGYRVVPEDEVARIFDDVLEDLRARYGGERS
ncbi:MAG: proteasome subunit beta [Acidimicrobiia bacterium]